MKRRSIAAALSSAALACALATPTARAGDNQDACGAVLCLAGLILGGNGGKTCAEYEASYFSIVKFHNGHFDLSGTSSARGDFLNQCQSVGSDVKGPVNSKYGAVQNGP
ncbi:TrbM/KikA/MpfK family conjugal transfer protein [Paraburkholderia tagetis]|uniref:Killer protein n=1 Tax=Paraburkholderia tagetis TaxID=2913261 RepID=A0A9X1RUI1_9BURK|nr:TrbM/KikA/MpfK family conjugal transfer protein [Paraburkholderia tagetis]MCG5076302.1 killer protein [Paraburkholderia tagetis]